MNFRQAKQIPIVEYLADRGVQPSNIQGNQFWYNSPLRSEKTSSFKVDSGRNIWFDHGAGQGGTIIELIQALENVSPTGALDLLASNETRALPVRVEEVVAVNRSASQGVKIKSAKLLNNPVLIRYLESRKIPFQIGRRYLTECYYSIGEKNFFALGFQNDLGGYELRNQLWQTSSSPKAVTTYQNEERGTIAVFEGFFDMLSALVYFEKDKPAHSVLVLNSVSLLDTALPTLRQYERVHLFLDNDAAGRKAVGVIQETCQSVSDYSGIYYPHHKDFNEFLASSSQ